MTFERLEQIVHDALALSADQRDAFLDRACGDDIALRREVVSLLKHEATAEALFDDSAVDWTDALANHDRSHSTPSDEIETQVGPYRLVEHIGAGGMGNVYKAVRDDDEFEQTVAVKRIRRGMDTEDVLQRFRRERQVLAGLVHPNIARLLDGGSTEDGRPYLVMEYVDGQRIDAYCDEHRLTIRQRIDLFCTVCQAVQFAHRNLVVHRDLKPGNILVRTDAQATGSIGATVNGQHAAEVSLLDFGIAKVLNADASDATAEITSATEARLTLAYASPEQVRRESVTTSSDVYSLGVILYELLVGARPLVFDHLTPLEIEKAICESPPRRVADALPRHAPALERLCHARQADPSHLRRELTGDLETILLKALAKDPERRYSSAEALADDLRRYLDGLPVTAQRDSTAYRVRKFVARHRAGVLAAVGVAGLTVAALALITTLYVQASAAQSAEAQARRTAEAINTFLIDMLSSVDPRNEGVDATVRDVLDASALRAETELADYPDVEQVVQNAIGRAYMAIGLYNDAQPHLERAITLSENVNGSDHPETAAALDDLGVLHRHMGQYEHAEALHRRALAIHQHHFGESSRASAQSMNNLAQVLYDQGRYDEGRPYYTQSFAIRSADGGADVAAFIASLNNQARARVAEGDYADADRILRETYALYRELYGDDHVETIGAVNNVAFIAMMRGRFDEAEERFNAAIEQYRAVYGESHPDIARALNNLGECIRRQGRHADAEPIHREALAMRRDTLGSDHPLVAVSMNNLGLTVSQLERYDEALTLHEEALAIRQDQLGPRHPDVATTLGNIGYVLEKTGSFEAAESHLRDALAIRLDAFGEAHPLVANTRTNLARCLLLQNRPDEAETLARLALDAKLTSLGSEHPETNAARAALGRALMHLARYDEAESLLLEAHAAARDQRGSTAQSTIRIARDIVDLYERWARPDDAAIWTRVVDGADEPSP
jgi:eukaryotic-like serine/threonine-protein kinase